MCVRIVLTETNSRTDHLGRANGRRSPAFMSQRNSAG
jgi:hypothetical protein